MFEVKEISIRKIYIYSLTVVLLSCNTQLLAQQQDFIREDNSGKFLNSLLNIDVVANTCKDFCLLDIPANGTVFEQGDIRSLVQKAGTCLPWTLPAVELTDYDLHQWVDKVLGFYKPHPEQSNIREVSVTSSPNKVLDLQQPKFEKSNLIEAILALQHTMQSENPLMNLVWQIDENMDFAIVGQYQIDMAYPDFIEYLKNYDEDQTKNALYAKLTLRF